MSSAVSKSSQTKAIKEFKSVTGATEDIATKALNSHSWNLERALDYFFTNRSKFPTSSSSSSSSSKVDSSKLAKLFDKYSTGDTITVDGMPSFFQDIAVSPSSYLTFAVVWALRCKSYGEITRKEFSEGWTFLGADSLDKMKSEVKRIETRLRDKKQFKEFYRWLFDFVKDSEERKTLDSDVAYEVWSLILPSQFPLWQSWIEFCKEKQKLKSVPKDLWSQILEFSREVNADCSNYDPDGAWPVIIDEFVDYVRAQKTS